MIVLAAAREHSLVCLTPRILCWNASGLWANKLWIREGKLKLLFQKGSNHDVILVQEINLRRYQFPAFQTKCKAHGWRLHVNISNDAKFLGTAILLREEKAAKFSVRYCTLIRHYACRLELWSKDEKACFLGCSNVYFDSREKSVKRIQIRTLGNYFTRRFTELHRFSCNHEERIEIIGGYLNMHLSAADRWILDPAAPLKGRWTAAAATEGALFREVLMRGHGFQEIPQMEPTLRGRSNKYLGYNDKFFVRMAPAIASSVHSAASVFFRPKRCISDHVMISLNLSIPKKGEKAFQTWVLGDPEFNAHVASAYYNFAPLMQTSWMRLRLFNACMWEAHNSLVTAGDTGKEKKLRETDKGPAGQLGLSIAITRLLTCGPSEGQKHARWFQQVMWLRRRIPGMEKLVLPACNIEAKLHYFKFSLASLSEHIIKAHEQYVSAQLASVRAAPDGPNPEWKAKARENISKTAQRLLPGANKSWDAPLPEEGGEPVTSPQGLGGLQFSFWGEVFDYMAPDRSTWTEIFESIPRTCPHFDPPSEGDYCTRITDSGDSACGPNRLPQKAYRTAKSLAAKVLHDASKDLISVGAPMPFLDFNAGFLACLLKKKWEDRPTVGRCVRISDTRSITVRNSDCKLLYGGFKYKLVPALKECLEPEQYLFSSIIDNVTLVQSEFHLLARGRSRGGLLLIDKKQAFPSISHEFLEECMKRMGFPDWFREALRKMLHNIRHIVRCRGWKGLGAWVRRGVPQGDPLAMFFFCIAFNSYIVMMKKVIKHNEVFAAYCDDAAMILRSLVRAVPCIRVGDIWGKGSTCFGNMEKHAWIPGNPPSQRERLTFRVRAREFGYQNMAIKDADDHLGVAIGRKVGPDEVFMAAFGKVCRLFSFWRCGPFSPFFRSCIVQTFILSVTGYLEQFQLMPRKMRGRIKLLTICFVFKLSMVAYAFLTVWNGVGGGRNLPDPEGRNLASLCRARKFTGLSDEWIKKFRLPFTSKHGGRKPVACHWILARKEFIRKSGIRPTQVFDELTLLHRVHPAGVLRARKQYQRTLSSRLLLPFPDHPWWRDWLGRRFSKMGNGPLIRARFLEESNLWGRKGIPVRVVVSALRVIFNGLFTERRMAQIKTKPCHFCAALQVERDIGDSGQHIARCPRIWEALISLGCLPFGPIQDDASWVDAWGDGLLLAPRRILMLDRDGPGKKLPFPFVSQGVFNAHNLLRHSYDEVLGGMLIGPQPLPEGMPAHDLAALILSFFESDGFNSKPARRPRRPRAVE